MNSINRRCRTMFGLSVLSLVVFGDLSAAPLRSKLPNGKIFIGSAEEKRAMRQEKYRDEINFCLENIGKRFNPAYEDLRRKLNGYSQVTYELIAEKYNWYGDEMKRAEYYYKDWLEYNKIGKNRIGGNNTSLGNAIGVWRDAGLYARALEHYEEFYKYSFSKYAKPLASHKEIAVQLKKEMEADPEVRQYYNDFMSEWDRIKQLAKTEKPKPLEPAVQNHEWFYSDKQEEVLKALEYYYNNKVRFMLEKALKHKDSVVAAKAKEHMDKLSETAKK